MKMFNENGMRIQNIEGTIDWARLFCGQDHFGNLNINSLNRAIRMR